MAVPRKVFIDTSIFDGCSYNFESAAIQPIADIAKKESLTLLLPESTEQEVRRHIKDFSGEVFAALSKAHQRAPFLRKWKEWPIKSKDDYLLSYRLNKMATEELEAFFALFELIRLDASSIVLPDVMNWYDKGMAPFGKGKKKSEFPDAFALSSLLTFAKGEEEIVAVISSDGDFQSASALYDCLFFYRTPGAYVESLLLSDEHVKKVRAILDDNPELIGEGLSEEFVSLAFYPVDDEDAELEDAEVNDVVFSDLNVVGAGDKEVSVSFEAEVSFSIEAGYDVEEMEGFGWCTNMVHGESIVNGIAKLSVTDDWSAFKSLDIIRLDEESIGVEARPSMYGERW